mmetsp:Transcript_29840/g.63548  ORF Transcript_29840/g.63548 Transcript_29840/m.63548 type:complete len:465 (+) Transcript_29840:80-1474(+)
MRTSSCARADSHERVYPRVVLRGHEPSRAQARGAHHLPRPAAGGADLAPLDLSRPAALAAGQVPAPLAVEALVLLLLRDVVHLDDEKGGKHAHGPADEGGHDGVDQGELPRQAHGLDELEVRQPPDAEPDLEGRRDEPPEDHQPRHPEAVDPVVVLERVRPNGGQEGDRRAVRLVVLLRGRRRPFVLPLLQAQLNPEPPHLLHQEEDGVPPGLDVVRQGLHVQQPKVLHALRALDNAEVLRQRRAVEQGSRQDAPVFERRRGGGGGRRVRTTRGHEFARHAPEGGLHGEGEGRIHRGGQPLHLGHVLLRGLLQGEEGRALLPAGRVHPDLLHVPAPRVREQRRGVQEARDRRDLLPFRERLVRHEQVGPGPGSQERQGHPRRLPQVHQRHEHERPEGQPRLRPEVLEVRRRGQRHEDRADFRGTWKVRERERGRRPVRRLVPREHPQVLEGRGIRQGRVNKDLK